VKNLKLYLVYLCFFLNGCNSPDYYEVKNSTINNAIVHMWPDGMTEIFDQDKIIENYYSVGFSATLNMSELDNIKNNIPRSCYHGFFSANLNGAKRYYFTTNNKSFIADKIYNIKNLEQNEIEKLFAIQPLY
jgi:hypothetical protein